MSGWIYTSHRDPESHMRGPSSQKASAPAELKKSYKVLRISPDLTSDDSIKALKSDVENALRLAQVHHPR